MDEQPQQVVRQPEPYEEPKAKPWPIAALWLPDPNARRGWSMYHVQPDEPDEPDQRPPLGYHRSR